MPLIFVDIVLMATSKLFLTAMASTLVAMASNLQAMASTFRFIDVLLHCWNSIFRRGGGQGPTVVLRCWQTGDRCLHLASSRSSPKTRENLLSFQPALT